MRLRRYFVMLTYTCSNLQPWAQLSTDGVLFLTNAAPVGTATLNLSVTDGTTTWTKSLALQVNAKQAAEQWFSVSTAAPRRIAFRLHAVSEPVKFQPAKVKFNLIMKGPPRPPAAVNSVALKLTAFSEESEYGGS